jgi:hypothetical protein
MVNSKVALLLPDLGRLTAPLLAAFLSRADKVTPPGSMVICDADVSCIKGGLVNLTPHVLPCSNHKGDTLKWYFSKALELGADEIVTFDQYTTKNATWFSSYLGLGNVTESEKTAGISMIMTKVSNVISFGNAYNAFSMNRIFTKASAISIVNSHLGRNSIRMDISKALNNAGIKQVEIIKESHKSDYNLSASEIVESVKNGFSKFFVFYCLSSSMSYIVSIMLVYASLSAGLFYPLAVFWGNEVGTVSNFFANEAVNSKQRNITKSIYKLGKFNAITLIPTAVDIVLVGFISRLVPTADKALFASLSVASIMGVSFISFMFLSTTVWQKGNSVKVKL